MYEYCKLLNWNWHHIWSGIDLMGWDLIQPIQYFCKLFHSLKLPVIRYLIGLYFPQLHPYKKFAIRGPDLISYWLLAELRTSFKRSWQTTIKIFFRVRSFKYLQGKFQLTASNGILLPELFWLTVRKKCSSDWEKLLKFDAEGREFAK